MYIMEDLNVSESCISDILDIIEAYIDSIDEFNKEQLEKVKNARNFDVDFATNLAAVANAKATMARKQSRNLLRRILKKQMS